MAFTYQMVETDLLQVYQSLDEARRQTFYCYQAANKAQDTIAVGHLNELSAKLNQASIELADLKRKVEQLKKESDNLATKG